MSLLTVQDLAVARGGMRAVEGVTFSLAAGQALILRGPNGIGKTTLLRTIAGLQPPVQGRIAMPRIRAAASRMLRVWIACSGLGPWAWPQPQSSS